MKPSGIKKKIFKPLFAIVLIIVTTTVIYSNVYQCPFIFDDLDGIIKQPKIRSISNYLSFEQLIQSRGPVNLTFALNYRFGNLNVFGYHLINVFVHAINGILVYFLSLILFKHLIPHRSRSSSFMALFSALIFTAHPVQTQA
ncbi:MAG: hypothetical protein QGH40_10530, partial [bacterium]|nr:hypothetical protein [bacterium]